MLTQDRVCAACPHFVRVIPDGPPPDGKGGPFCKANQNFIKFYDPAYTCPVGEWKPMVAYMRGLGDVVKRVTDALGIPQCGGCAGRQETLNKLLPFGSTSSPPAGDANAP